MTSTLFSPERQSNAWDIQTTIRQIDMSLFPSVKAKIGIDQTFVYSTLAGCCSFIGLLNLDKFSPEIQIFARETVEPVVKECFEEIEKSSCDLTNTQLKLSLMKKIDRIQFYPKKSDFETIHNEEMIAELQKIINTGTYTLYKVDPSSDRFYGGRIDISEETFLKTAQNLEKFGYQQENDTIGSSFDKQGHITTIDPRELTQNYEAVVASHDAFTKDSNKVSLKPICIKRGNPQSGRMSRVVTVSVEVNGLEKYRGILGAMKVPPHLSVFSQEIQTIPSLKDVAIKDFANDENNSYLKKLHRYLSTCL